MSRVLLADVLQSPQDFGYNGNIHLRPISHKPIGGEILLPRSQTGWHEDQTIKIENDYTWHPFLYNGKVAITSEELGPDFNFNGEVGYDNAIYWLTEITKLHLSEMTEVAELTSEMYEAMPKTLKRMCYWYWLFEQYESKTTHRRGLWAVDLVGVHGYPLYDYDSGSPAVQAGWYPCSLRPTVYPKSGTCIDTDQLNYTREPLTCFLPESENQREKDEEVTMEMIYGEIKKLQEQMAKMEKKLTNS